MTSESDKGGGEGSGLPVGVEWHYVEGTGGALLRLFKDPDDILAVARADGSWDAWGAGVSRRIRANVHAQRRPDETLLAAAQREAEAALWARDGFEVGEVRGRFVAHGQGFGLPGRWRTKAVCAVEGGHEIDAVRAGGEPAPSEPVGPYAVRAPVVEPPRRPRPMPPVAPGAGRGEGDEEDEPDPCAKHDATGSNIGWQSWCPGCNVALHSEPAPREPSAHTDGAELARLLPGLLDYCAAVLAEPDEDTRSRLGVGKHLALACKLLLAERAKTERRIAILMQTADAGEIAVGALERLRARAEEAERRVAELPAARLALARSVVAGDRPERSYQGPMPFVEDEDAPRSRRPSDEEEPTR